MIDFLGMLIEFHKTLFNKTGDWRADIGQKFIPQNSTALLRDLLHIEEQEELSDELWGELGDGTASKAGMLKELCDYIYVGLGTAVIYFTPEQFEEAFKVVHADNMAKFATGIIREDGKLMKSPNHPKIDLTQIAEGFCGTAPRPTQCS